MSKQEVIEGSIDLDNPQEHEKLFLQDRGLLQGESVPVVFRHADGTVVSNNQTYVANQLNEDRISELVEARARELAEEMVARLAMEQQHEDNIGKQPDTGKATGAEPSTSAPGAWAPGSRQNPSAEPEADQDEEEEDVSYSDWTTDELRTELASRDLHVGGNKADLIARLEADDEES